MIEFEDLEGNTHKIDPKDILAIATREIIGDKYILYMDGEEQKTAYVSEDTVDKVYGETLEYLNNKYH